MAGLRPGGGQPLAGPPPNPLAPEPFRTSEGGVGDAPASVDPHLEKARDAERVSEPADNHNDAPPSKVPGVGTDEAAVLQEDDRI